MVLRPSGQSYKVVGECFVGTLSDSTALLSVLPEPWRVVCTVYNNSGAHRFCYVNQENGTRTFEDPRLEPLDGWGIARNRATR